MRKEYTPAIILYVVSAIFYIVAVLGAFIDSHHWATFLLAGVLVMLLASSKLVKIGKKLGEKEKREEPHE